MSWENVDVRGGEFATSYRGKYGIESSYQADQKLIYSCPEIRASFEAILSHLTISLGQQVLDIGINNGYELKLIAAQKPNLTKTHVIGIDLAGDILSVAKEEVAVEHLTLLEGDIRRFTGKNILTGCMEKINDDSIDVLIALLSLQSTCLQDTFEIFLETLERKMKRNSEILIGIPDFHITAQKQISRGLFDAHAGKLDTTRASQVSGKISSFFKAQNFREQNTGTLVIFQHFSRK